MNILITTGIFPPDIGGPSTYVYELCQRLQSRHRLTVITFTENFTPLSGIRIIALKTRYNFLGTFFRQFSLLSAIFKNLSRGDILYAQGLYVVGFMSAIASFFSGKPLLIKFVGDLVWETAFGDGKTRKNLDEFLTSPDIGLAARIKIRIQASVIRQASKVIVPSEYLKSVLMKYYKVPNEKIRVIFNAFDPKSLPSVHHSRKHNEPKHTEPIKLITVGRLVPWKHIDGIIQALPIILKSDPVHLIIIGDGPERHSLESLSRNLHIEHNVSFLGRLDMSQTIQVLACSDIFILNSSYEGLPHTVIEAMFLSIPVIATNIPGTNEIAQDQKTALLVRVNDNVDLAQKVLILLHNSELRETLKAKAHHMVTHNFSWSQHVNKLEKVLETLYTLFAIFVIPLI